MSLADDDRTRILVEPFTVFMDLDEIDKLPAADDLDEIRRENGELIPHVLPALRKLAQIRAREGLDTGEPTRKAGRNEPCPCGSGKKYKRCCGLN